LDAEGRDVTSESKSRRGGSSGRSKNPRRHRLPERWRAELGRVDEDTVLIMASLAQLSRTIYEAYGADLHSFGLTYSEYAALHTLRIEGAPYRMSPSRLNRVLALSSGGITKTVDRLESAGLVRRMPDPNDGRGVLVGLTVRGRRTAARIFDTGLRKYSETLDRLSRAERRRLVESLSTLRDAFEGAAKP
jgi:DNA-binding MarR family transcriptional regulator